MGEVLEGLAAAEFQEMCGVITPNREGLSSRASPRDEGDRESCATGVADGIRKRGGPLKRGRRKGRVERKEGRARGRGRGGSLLGGQLFLSKRDLRGRESVMKRRGGRREVDGRRDRKFGK